MKTQKAIPFTVLSVLLAASILVIWIFISAPIYSLAFSAPVHAPQPPPSEATTSTYLQYTDPNGEWTLYYGNEWSVAKEKYWENVRPEKFNTYIEFVSPEHEIITVRRWDSATQLDSWVIKEAYISPIVRSPEAIQSLGTDPSSASSYYFEISDDGKSPSSIYTAFQCGDMVFRLQYITFDGATRLQDYIDILESLSCNSEQPSQRQLAVGGELANVSFSPPSVPESLDVSSCHGYEDTNGNRYDCGQCTWWANYSRPDIPDSDAEWESPAHGGNWDDRAREHPDFEVSPNPEPGAIAVWEGDPDEAEDVGHVAYVTGVNSDNTFNVTEMNWDVQFGLSARSDIPDTDEINYILGGIAVFVGTDFNGEWVRVRDRHPDLHHWKNYSTNDPNVSSVFVPAGWNGVLYQDINYGRDAYNYVEGTSDLDSLRGSSLFDLRDHSFINGFSMNDNILSVEASTEAPFCSNSPESNVLSYASTDDDCIGPTDPPPSSPIPPPPPSHCPSDDRPGLYFYSDTNYSGSCFFSTENVSDFATTMLGDNELESVRIIGEWKAKLYKDRNYGGSGSEEINHSEPDINGRSLGGQVSSAKVISTHVDSNCEPTNRQGIYLYADKNYRGACHYTDQDINNLGNTAVGDNNVSSARVVGNYTIKLYEHPNQQGRSKEISRDDNDLDSESIGGMYSSMRIRPQEGSNLVSSINAPHGVSWQKCGKGDKVYMDRDYKFTGFSNSEYDGRWCITFPNDDKRDSSEKYVTFELNRPASVYIYFDRRMSRPPSWTGSLYNKNSKKVYTSEDDMDYFVVYSCKSHPGKITLGGPHFQGGDGANAMYVVAFKEEQGGEQLCSGVRVAPTPTYTPTPTPTATPTFQPTATPPIPPTPTYTPTPASPLQVVEDLNLAEQNPAAGETVSVRFKVRNVSGRVLTLRRLGVAAKGPNCNEWDCPRVADWPWEEHLTLQPGQVFTFDRQRAFPDVGDGYFGQILFSLTDNDWNHIGSVRHFSVSPGLKVIEPLTLNPSNPRIGEQVMARYRVKNTGNRPISLRHLGVVAKGPDCNDWNCPRWADFPAIENVTLQPGQMYLYQQQRSFSEAGGNYFADPAFGDHNGWWFFAPGGQRVNFNVSATLQLQEDLSISAQNPAAGETISARFRVKNVSGRTLTLRRLGVAAKGPNCSTWDCPRVADWPWEEHLTLQPGQVYTFNHQRAFPDTGGGYFGQILFSLTDNDWNHIGSERHFTVSQGLKVIQSLTLNPSSPRAGETVTARYKVKNTGSRPISLRYLGVVAKGPNCNDWDCSRWADFPAVENITLHPGQVYTYQKQRSFSEAGANYFADPAFGDHNGWWFFAPGGQRVNFSVSSAPSVTVTPSPTITPTATVQPGEGFCWAFEAENGVISGLDVVGSQDATGNHFVRTIHPWSSDNVHFSVNVPATDDYYIWARAKGYGWGDNSFFTSVDGGEQIHFEILPVNETEWIWDWQRLYHDDGSFPHRLGIGEHTIRFTSREADAQLDAVIISSDPDYIPTGMAECPTTVSTPTTVPTPTATPVPTDIIPPSGAFVEPAAEAEIGNPVWIRVGAQDDSFGSGIAEVIFTSNGTGSWQVITTDRVPPYEFRWDVRDVPDNHRFMIGAEIHDNAGNRTDIVRWVRSKSYATALLNGDFEQGVDIGWQQHSSHGWQLIFHEDDANGPGFARSGSWEAWLGGDDDELSAITQQVTVPIDNPSLSFWYWSSSVDVCGYDFAGVLINNHEIDSFTLCRNRNTNGWMKHIISLESYAGQAVDLEIRTETDGSLNSNLFIDDVALGPPAQNDSIGDERGLSLDTVSIDINKPDVLNPSPTVQPETDLNRVWTPSIVPKRIPTK